MPAKALVFDIGNVLLRWDSEIPYRRLIPDDAARRHFLTENPAAGMECRAGSWPLLGGRRGLADRAVSRSCRADPRLSEQNWHEMVPGPLVENVAVLDAAQARGIPCYAITNFAADTFAEASERFFVSQTLCRRTGFRRGRIAQAGSGNLRLFLERYSSRRRIACSWMTAPRMSPAPRPWLRDDPCHAGPRPARGRETGMAFRSRTSPLHDPAKSRPALGQTGLNRFR